MRAGHILKRSLAGLGVYRRRLLDAPFPGVAVLAYHGVLADETRDAGAPGGPLHVRASTLAAHCAVLRSHCTPIDGARFLRIAAGAETAPPRAVLVTFDDGYAGVLTHGIPVLEQYAIPAVVFVCTGPIARREHFWYDAVEMQAGSGRVDQLKGQPYDAWRRAVDAAAMSADAAHPLAPLSVAQLQALASHPLVEIGAHTVDHPILAAAPADVQERQIAGSRTMLSEWLGVAPELFAYPNGRPGLDFTDETAACVARYFSDGFAVGEAFTCPSRRRYEQRRFLMLDSVGGAELAHRLAVSWPRLGP